MRYLSKVSVFLLAFILVTQPILAESEVLSPEQAEATIATPVSVTETQEITTVTVEEVTATIEETASPDTSLPVEVDTDAVVVEIPVSDVVSDVTVLIPPIEENDDTISSEIVTPVVTEEAEIAPLTFPTPQLFVRQATPAAEAALSNTSHTITAIPGELIIKYKDQAVDLKTTSGKRASSRFARQNDLVKKEDIKELNASLVTVTDGRSIVEKIEELSLDPAVAFVQPNYQYQPTSITSNDTSKDLLWGLDNIGQEVNGQVGTEDADIDAPEAWAINEGTNAPVIVAVIDTGVAYNHPDLASNMWDGTNCKDENGNALGGCLHGYDYEDEDLSPLPTYDFHGTHVAGTIAAVKDNERGIVGVAPHAQIMALKTSFSTIELVKSISFAKHNGARIINGSFGGYFDQSSEDDQLLKDAIADFPGLFIAAAGNDSSDNDDMGELHFVPASYDLPNIISVAATDQDDLLADFSNYGSTSVDVGAPGTNIYSTIPAIDEVTYIQTVYTENFDDVESPEIPSTWSKEATSTWGTVALGGSFGNVLYGDTAYPYGDNGDSYIISPTYPLDPTAETQLSFFVGCDTEYSTGAYYDYVVLEYSADGTTFTPEWKFDEELLDAINGEDPLDEAGGAYHMFTNIVIPEEYATNDFKFRLHWISNNLDNEHDGCFIDNVRIVQTVTEGDTDFADGEEYTYLDGTSMAAPHVAGLAALIEGYHGSLSDSEVKDIILATGDTVPDLVGKTVTGKRVNAHNALTSLASLVSVKTITNFTAPGQIGDTQINEELHTISLTITAETDITTLTPSIDYVGASLSPASGIPQDFTTPVSYTVTAQDGTVQTYIVSVTQETPQITPPTEPRKTRHSNGSGTKIHHKKNATLSPIAQGSLVGASNASMIHKPHFGMELAFGSHESSVVELQKILIAEKYLKIIEPTGYFGPMTEAALREYQKHHGLQPTGVVDTATRQVLNGATMSTEMREKMIREIQAQLLLLTKELKSQIR